MNNYDKYRKECLRRYYENMDKPRAIRFMSLPTTSKKVKKLFVKRVNYAKDYEFLRVI